MSNEEMQKMFEEISIEEDIHEPLLLAKKTEPPKIYMRYQTEKLQSSVKRSKPYAKMLIGKSVYEAMFILSSHIQKVPKFLKENLSNSLEIMSKKNLTHSYMYIQGIVTSRRTRRYGIRYHGRVKSGKSARDHVDFTIYFGRRNIKDFYKDLVMGKDHSNLNFVLRQKLQDPQTEVEQLRSLQWILTSKGRQQKRLLLKRKALYKYLDFKRVGVNVKLRVLLEKEAEKEAVEFMENWAFMFNDSETKEVTLEERRALYLLRSQK
jgi:hypothetical protein